MSKTKKTPEHSANGRTLKALPSLILSKEQCTIPFQELTPETLADVRRRMCGHLAYQISDLYSSDSADWQKIMDFASRF